MPTFTLQVVGNADIPKPAEQANLKLAALSTGADRKSVSDDVLRTAKLIEDMIAEVQTQTTDPDNKPVPHWSQTSLTTNSWIEHQPANKVSQGPPTHPSGLFRDATNVTSSETQEVEVRRYRASIGFVVHFRDFALLSEFSSHLTSLEHCEIENLDWILLPATEARYKSELRHTAAQDALAKVKDYCQAFCPGEDAVIVPTKLVGENGSGGLFATARNIQMRSGFFGEAGHATASKGEGLSFSPQEINMVLSVEMIFTVETKGFRLDSK